MNDLKDDLREKIEEWASTFPLDGESEVSSVIAETNGIYTEQYPDRTDLEQVDESTFKFTCHVIMTGEPRKDEVFFGGEKILVEVHGEIHFDPDLEEWKIVYYGEAYAGRETNDEDDYDRDWDREVPGLKHISISNFKGIGSKIDVDIKPVTLLFGPNSAGKSTILHTIHCIHTILATGNADVERTLLGGDIDLGGFKNFVHNRDYLNKAVHFQIEIAPSSDDLFDLLEKPYESSHQRAPIAAWQIHRIGVSLRIEWSPYKQTAIVTYFHVSINGENVAQLGADINGSKTWLTVMGEHHPLLRTVDDQDDEWNLQEEQIPIPLKGFGALPDANIVNLYKMVNRYEPVTMDDEFHAFAVGEEDIERLSRIGLLMSLARPCVLKALERFRYVGPIRRAPERNYLAPKNQDEKRWANGLGAWDVMSRSETLRQRVNEWLSGADKLDTGYAVESVSFKELDDTTFIRMKAAFENGELDDQFTRLAAKLKESGRLVIRDQKKDLELSLCDLGEGITQVVPIVAAAVDSEITRGGGRKDFVQTVILEQPELHIHPRMQVVLGDLFLSQCKERQFLIETHSEHIMLRLLRRIRQTHDNELPAGAPSATTDTVSVLYVEQVEGEVRITPLRTTEDGDFADMWPQGFFSERMQELL